MNVYTVPRMTRRMTSAGSFLFAQHQAVDGVRREAAPLKKTRAARALLAAAGGHAVFALEHRARSLDLLVARRRGLDDGLRHTLGPELVADSRGAVLARER